MSVLLWSLLVILAAFAARPGEASDGHDGAKKGWLMKRSLNADSVNSTREMEGLR